MKSGSNGNAVKYGILFALLLCALSSAMDGICVFSRYSKYQFPFKLYGDLMIAVIKDSKVVEERKLETEDYVIKPIISMDGTTLAYYRFDGTLCLQKTSGGPEHVLVSGLKIGPDYRVEYRCIEWPEGDWIYYSGDSAAIPENFRDQDTLANTIEMINVKTGEQRHLFNTGFSTIFCLDRFGKRAVLDISWGNAWVLPDIHDPGPREDFSPIGAQGETNPKWIEMSGNVSCGYAIAPDGNLLVRNADGDHKSGWIFEWGKWNESVKLVNWENESKQWCTVPGQCHCGFRSSVSANWSCNSNEWIIEAIINKGYSALSLINPWTQERIDMSNSCSQTQIYEYFGDLWVGDPDVALAGEGVMNRRSHSPRASRARPAGPGAGHYYDTRGRRIEGFGHSSATPRSGVVVARRADGVCTVEALLRH